MPARCQPRLTGVRPAAPSIWIAARPLTVRTRLAAPNCSGYVTASRASRSATSGATFGIDGNLAHDDRRDEPAEVIGGQRDEPGIRQCAAEVGERVLEHPLDALGVGHQQLGGLRSTQLDEVASRDRQPLLGREQTEACAQLVADVGMERRGLCPAEDRRR